MEEEKAAAYYDELTRKGEGAAKFKQGLGFSSSSSAASDAFTKKPSTFSLSSFVRASGNKDADSSEKISAFSSSSSSLSNFARASGPERNDREDRARVLGSIQDKLGSRRRSPEGGRERRRERRDEREGDEARYSSKRSRESRDSDRERRRRRSRSRSYSPPRVSHSRDRDRDRERDRKRDKDRSSKESKSDRVVDYSQLIDGYSRMTPAERVKEKMKLQLSRTAAKDTTMGMSSGWERFDFNKDAPLDDDEEETEVAEDDISVVKNIGRSFRFSAVEARREEELKAAHDLAMFGGAAVASSSVNLTHETVGSAEGSDNDTTVGNNGNDLTTTPLLSNKVLSMQQGSWRDRARRLQNESEKR